MIVSTYADADITTAFARVGNYQRRVDVHTIHDGSIHDGSTVVTVTDAGYDQREYVFTDTDRAQVFVAGLLTDGDIKARFERLIHAARVARRQF
jgi:hypothetical protein